MIKSPVTGGGSSGEDDVGGEGEKGRGRGEEERERERTYL